MIADVFAASQPTVRPGPATPVLMSSHSSVDFRPLIKTRGGGASKSAATFATIFAAADDTSVSVDSDTDESGLLNMRHSASGSSIALDMLPMPDWRQSVSKPLTYKMGNSTITFQASVQQSRLPSQFAFQC